MNGLETLLGISNILDEWKPYKLDELFNFKSISHLKFGHIGNTWLITPFGNCFRNMHEEVRYKMNTSVLTGHGINTSDVRIDTTTFS
jgi:hypothetical protein